MGLGGGLNLKRPDGCLKLYSVQNPTNAALIWWRMTQNTMLIGFVTFRGIFGLSRSTPTAAKKMILDIGGLELDIKGCAAQTANRLIYSNERAIPSTVREEK